MNKLFYFAAGVSLFSLVGLTCVLLYRMEKRIAARRLFDITRQKTSAVASAQVRTKAASLISPLQSLLRRLPLHFMRDRSLPRRLSRAGFKNPEAVEIYIAVRVAIPVTGLIAACLAFHHGILLVAIPAVGYLLPDLILRKFIAARNGEIRDSLPDAIDLLVICVEAGLGIDQAIHRVNEELALRHPAITEEFAQLNLEQRAGKPRIQAWQAMAEKLEIEEISSFLNMLIQTERFGTPVSRALSNFAENMREKRRQRAEEKAAKTAVKITLPLALFIFPSILIVLLGPAFLNLLHNFPSIGR
jgi:tight adherence protein C